MQTAVRQIICVAVPVAWAGADTICTDGWCLSTDAHASIQNSEKWAEQSPVTLHTSSSQAGNAPQYHTRKVS